MTLSPCAVGAELAWCQRRSRSITGKNGDDGKVAAAGSPSEREQMGGEVSTKVEAAKRRGQVQNEEGGKAAQVHLAKWISVEYREEVHEKIQRKMRYLLWDRAQTEEGGNGGAV